LLTTPNSFSLQDYEKVVESVIRIFDESFNSIQQSQAGEIAACIVRTAGHDFMDLRVNVNGKLEGGSDGCMDFSDPSNNGVANCLINFGYLKAYNEVCDKVRVEDFIEIAEEAIMERTAKDYALMTSLQRDLS